LILVTGGTGLLGTHVLFELLKAGKQVRALACPKGNVQQVLKAFSYYSADAEKLVSSIQWFDGKLNDIYSLLEAMDGVDEVYHCAGIVSFDPKDEQILHDVNVEGTANMVNAALEKGIKKFCHVSSISAIGNNSDDLITENTYWKFSPENSLYAISKYGAEREVWRAAEEGLNVIVVNPSVIIGPGDWKSSSSGMFTSAHKASRFYAEGVTGFVDVRDVAAIMVKLMVSPITRERFIVSSENVSFKRFYEWAGTSLAKPVPSLKAGKIIMGIAWRIDKMRSSVAGHRPLLTKEVAKSAQQKKYYSNEKISRALNYNFIPVEK
jgi:dihydroflavonol-4-reductase